MTMTISGDGTITGLVAGGLPDATITQAELSTNVAGNGPAFSAYQSSAQTLSSSTWTKITFTSLDFDTTGGMYASSRFTPTIAGYYQVNSAIAAGTIYTTGVASIYKNGSIFKQGNTNNGGSGTSNGWTVNAIVYLNGSTDYIEIYGNIVASQPLAAGVAYTYFQAFLAKAA
jgi:hypothetical protein